MDKETYIPSKEELWKYILNEGRKVETKQNRIANKFDTNDINTIVSTMSFFGATDVWIAQTIYDLTKARYRLFDWLGMCVMSRNDDNRKQNEMALKVLVYVWLKTEGNPKEFINDLRINDYQIDESWEAVEIP